MGALHVKVGALVLQSGFKLRVGAFVGSFVLAAGALVLQSGFKLRVGALRSKWELLCSRVGAFVF